ALMVELDGEHVLVRHGQELIVREERRLARAHVRPDCARALDARIGRLPDALVEGADCRLPRLLQTSPGPIQEPSVVDAAQSTVLDSPVGEIRSAVRAMQSQEAGLAFIVPEEHELLAEELQ